MNTFHSAGSTEAGEVASQSRHPTLPSQVSFRARASVDTTLLPFLSSESVRESLAASAAPAPPPIKFPARPGDHPSLPTGDRRFLRRRRRNLFHRKVVYHN